MEEQPEAKPTEKKKTFNWAIILWPVVIVSLYVLSAGPFVMMVHNGDISKHNRFFQAFYRPLSRAYLLPLFHKPFGMYLHIWVPEDYDKNGDVIDHPVRRF
jgi:hypothetical protein